LLNLEEKRGKGWELMQPVEALERNNVQHHHDEYSEKMTM
jgi:hypothetical protein